jgi:hypothetical protein
MKGLFPSIQSGVFSWDPFSVLKYLTERFTYSTLIPGIIYHFYFQLAGLVNFAPEREMTSSGSWQLANRSRSILKT